MTEFDIERIQKEQLVRAEVLLMPSVDYKGLRFLARKTWDNLEAALKRIEEQGEAFEELNRHYGELQRSRRRCASCELL